MLSLSKSTYIASAVAQSTSHPCAFAIADNSQVSPARLRSRTLSTSLLPSFAGRRCGKRPSSLLSPQTAPICQQSRALSLRHTQRACGLWIFPFYALLYVCIDDAEDVNGVLVGEEVTQRILDLSCCREVDEARRRVKVAEWEFVWDWVWYWR